jgi:hypothetical protein
LHDIRGGNVDLRLSELVTIVTTPHVYGKVVLVVTFGSSLCIVTVTYMGLFGTVDSVAGTMDLVDKENVMNYLAVSVNYG